jgi:hypothetical protein
MASSTAEKVRENRLRRMAQRQGLRLEKSRRRDPRALGFGRYVVIDVASGTAVGVLGSAQTLTLDEVEAHLTRD